MSDLLSNFGIPGLRVEDGQILSLVDSASYLEVRIVDFAEVLLTLRFGSVLRYEGMSPCGTDLGGALAFRESDLLVETCQMLGEDQAGYLHFDFVSAWDGSPILRVVAATAELVPTTEREKDSCS
jgi:hypothetical protein